VTDESQDYPRHGEPLLRVKAEGDCSDVEHVDDGVELTPNNRLVALVHLGHVLLHLQALQEEVTGVSCRQSLQTLVMILSSSLQVAFESIGCDLAEENVDFGKGAHLVLTVLQLASQLVHVEHHRVCSL